MLETKYPLPSNEQSRLDLLESTGIWRSGHSSDFDAIAEVASDILDCPIALISIVGAEEQWFKANVGLNAEGTSRDDAFCSYTIAGKQPLIVTDARRDDRFSSNPLVLGDPNIVFYAGFPISIDRQHNIGTICVIDRKPRNISPLQKRQMRRLARVTESLVTSFKDNQDLKLARLRETEKSRELERNALLIEKIRDLTGVGGWELVLDPPKLTWTDETKRIHEVPLDYEPQLETAIQFYSPEARPIIQNAVETALSTGEGWDLELPLITASGKRIWVHALGGPLYEDKGVVGLVGAFQDITERKQTEKRILTSERLAHNKSAELSTVLETMGEGVSVFDGNRNLTVWNQKYVELFRLCPEDTRKGISHQALLELEQRRNQFSDNLDAYSEELTTTLAQGETVTHQLRTHDGMVIQSLLAPLPDGGWVGTHADVTSQVLAAERDEYASRHDPLTGLSNRLAFNARLEHLLESDGQTQEAVVLMLVDLDHFKQVNDRFGHQIGDELLKRASSRIQQCVRNGDLVARLGGDEFAVVLACNNSDSRNISEQIARTITKEMTRSFVVFEHVIEIGASVGICVQTVKGADADTLFGKADQALYKVKEMRSHSYCYYDVELAAEFRVRTNITEAVKTSISSQSLELCYQPIFSLKTLEAEGCEALIRWKGSSGIKLSPIQLISEAESNGAIVNIGNWVLHRSIQAASSWSDRSRLSINVSPLQLSCGNFFDQVLCALNVWDFPATRLELEITENILVDEASSALGELLRIQDLGVSIALDDFGTGYASLNYLQRFTFDRLKIDRSFISRMTDSVQSKAIVKSVSAMAAELEIPVTAEGIETQAQLKEVSELGCTLGQGFYLSKPLPGPLAASRTSALQKVG